MDSKNNTNDKTNNKTNNKKEDNIILGYVYEFMNDNKLWLFVTICLIFISNPLEMIVLSNLFTSFSNAINKLDYDNSISILWKIAGLYILIDIINMIYCYLDQKYLPILEKFIRFKLVDVIFKNIEVNYDNENISNIILKLLNIPNLAIVYTQHFIYWILTFCITVFSILIYITYLNIEVGLIILFIFIVYFIIFYYTLKQVKNKSGEREREEKILMTQKKKY
jgi:ABC-type bacteriocin/lantibiotic exporter with double-glycine peptidase domain